MYIDIDWAFTLEICKGVYPPYYMVSAELMKKYTLSSSKFLRTIKVGSKWYRTRWPVFTTFLFSSKSDAYKKWVYSIYPYTFELKKEYYN